MSEKSLSKVSLKKNATYKYHNKRVTCLAENDVKKVEESRTITVFCEFKHDLTDLHHFKNIPIIAKSDSPRAAAVESETLHPCKSEGNCTVQVLFNAHPKPFSVEWKRSGEYLDSGKYKTSSEVEMNSVS